MLFHRSLEVDSASWISISLGADDHAMAPGDWFINWDRFNYSRAKISVKVSFNPFLSMNRHRYWCMMCDWIGSWINTKLQRWAAHEWERFVLAGVERAGFVAGRL